MRTEGAANVFARFLELMAARGRGDGKIASLAPGGADGRSAGQQAGEPSEHESKRDGRESEARNELARLSLLTLKSRND